MGLDTTHDCWHGPYSAFGRWRTELAKAAGGWDMVPNEYHPGEDRYAIRGDHIHPRTYQGWWDDDPDDLLDVLLIHSDCDGYIFPQHAEGLAKRLEEIAPQVPEGRWREATYVFARGLRRASEDWQIVAFR